MTDPLLIKQQFSADLQKLIQDYVDNTGIRITKYVFTYLGNRVIQTSTKAWYKALSRAGIEDFRWHDLRHTWASWMVQKGVPLHALQELGGWQSSDMVAKYAHLSSEHLKTYVDKK